MVSGFGHIVGKGAIMAKLMSKSELIQNIAERHPDKLTRKDVKDVIESLAVVGYKELKRAGASRLCQIRRYQKACNKGAGGHQSLHKRANNIQGEAGPKDRQGSPG
jgi:hypothetical protein